MVPIIKNDKVLTRILLLLLVMTAFFYVTLHNNYRLHYIDDGLVMSCNYNYLAGKSVDDIFRNPSGLYGQMLFGKTHAFTVGAVTALSGWDKTIALLCSTLLMFAGIFVWFFIARESGFDRDASLCLALMMLVFQPFFDTAHLARVDAMVFLFIAAAVIFFRARLHREKPLLPLLVLSMLVSTLVFKRVNTHYATCLFPAFLMFTLAAFEKIGRLRLLFGLLIAYYAIYYGYHFANHHDYDYHASMEQTLAAVPSDDLPVAGIPDYWATFRHRKFYPTYFTGELKDEKIGALLVTGICAFFMTGIMLSRTRCASRIRRSVSGG